jgi:16S rRNA (uracil1498-N3)-methyltransferase
MAERFYTSDALGFGEYALDGAEAHHLSTVRRLAPGERITLFNGDGQEYAAEILGVSRKSVALNILSASAVDRELPFSLIVASALPKGDRADYLIEKLTELGVTRFVPLVATRSVVIPKESSVAKFGRAVIEASKQCGRNRLMAIDPPLGVTDFLERADSAGARLFLHPTANDLAQVARPGGGATIAIGPEGGFTPDEVAAATAAAWTVAGLGSRILRIETAAVAAASLLALGTHSTTQ